MADQMDMTAILDLSALLSGEEARKDFDLALFPDLEDEDIRLDGAVRFSGTAVECGGFVRITGTIACDFSGSCARCLEKVRDRLEIAVELDCFEPDKMPAEENEDYVLIADSKADLMSVVYETLTVNLPTRLLCREDCRGLCPDCGANLNTTSCDCAGKKVDPRLAGLADFFNQ